MISIEQVRREIERAAARWAGIVRRGILEQIDSDYYAQSSMSADENNDQVELWQQFGLTSMPPAGGEALLAQVDGRGEGAVAIATNDRAHRPTGLASGDTVLYAAQGGGGGQALLHAKADGDVDLTAGTGKHVNVGGDSEALLLGETVTIDLKTFADALVSMPPSGTAVQNALALEAIRTAATALSGSTAAWLAAIGKVT